MGHYALAAMLLLERPILEVGGLRLLHGLMAFISQYFTGICPAPTLPNVCMKAMGEIRDLVFQYAISTAAVKSDGSVVMGLMGVCRQKFDPDKKVLLAVTKLFKDCSFCPRRIFIYPEGAGMKLHGAGGSFL